MDGILGGEFPFHPSVSHMHDHILQAVSCRSRYLRVRNALAPYSSSSTNSSSQFMVNSVLAKPSLLIP